MEFGLRKQNTYNDVINQLNKVTPIPYIDNTASAFLKSHDYAHIFAQNPYDIADENLNRTKQSEYMANLNKLEEQSIELIDKRLVEQKQIEQQKREDARQEFVRQTVDDIFKKSIINAHAQNIIKDIESGKRGLFSETVQQQVDDAMELSKESERTFQEAFADDPDPKKKTEVIQEVERIEQRNPFSQNPDDYRVSDLRDILKNHNISATGNKQELVNKVDKLIQNKGVGVLSKSSSSSDKPRSTFSLRRYPK